MDKRKTMGKLTKTVMTLAISSIIASSLVTSANASTRVFYNTDSKKYLISGRNFDYFGPVDPSLVITPRGISHNGGDAANVAKWETKYGSVVIYANDIFPIDGVNERGLTAHALYYNNGTQVQSDNTDKPVIESKAWITYILDNFLSVDQAVKAITNKVRLVAVKLPIDYPSDAIHIALEDVSGQSAIIEIDQGKVNIYQEKHYRVLTNPPAYSMQLKSIEQYSKSNSNQIPKDYSSISRSVRASFDINNLPKADNKVQAHGFVLSVLNDVAYPIGLPAGPEEQRLINDYAKFTTNPDNNKGVGTYWSTITDINNLEYHFKSTFATSSVWIPLKQIKFKRGLPVYKITHLNDYGKNDWEGNILSKAVEEK